MNSVVQGDRMLNTGLLSVQQAIKTRYKLDCFGVGPKLRLQHGGY